MHAGGAPPTDVTAEQTGLNTVFVMWTASSPPPAAADGYQVQITRGSTTTTVNVRGTSHTISVNNQYGVYSIQVIALSRPLPSDATEPVEVTVIGIGFGMGLIKLIELSSNMGMNSIKGISGSLVITSSPL